MSADPARRACQDCDYWERDPDEDPHDGIFGYCRRYAPRDTQAFARTTRGDWCGDYVSRTLQLSTEGQALATVKSLAKELEALAYMTEVAAGTLRSVTGKGATAQATHEAAKHATELARGYLG